MSDTTQGVPSPSQLWRVCFVLPADDGRMHLNTRFFVFKSAADEFAECVIAEGHKVLSISKYVLSEENTCPSK